MPESKRRPKPKEKKRSRRTNRPTGTSVRAIFGDRELKAILTNEAEDRTTGKSVEIAISEAELRRDPPDLSTRFRLFDIPSVGTDEGSRYGGYVTELERGPRGWWLLRSNNMAHLGDHLTGGIIVRNVAVPEMFWSTLRGAGFPSADIRVHGWKPQAEPILVVVPVIGLGALGTLQAGATSITSDRTLLQPFAGLEHEELKPLFMDADQWVTMTVAARTLFEAEQYAVRHFERVIGRLALAARYSSAVLPDGQLRSFRRKQLLERISLVQVAGVWGQRTGRLWLRGYAHPRVIEPTEPSVVTVVAEYIGASDRRIDDAISAWRRATAHDDPAVCVVSLGEAIEFYGAAVKVPKLFNKRELATLRASLPDGLREDKAARVLERIDGLNEPPFMARFRAAVDKDGARLSDGEMELLLAIRGMRNDILHGKERRMPTNDQLNQAISLVNRLLLFRLKRLREA